MSGTFLKNIVEEKIKVSEDKYENRVQITFEASSNDAPVREKITLVGEGSLKVLMPV